LKDTGLDLRIPLPIIKVMENRNFNHIYLQSYELIKK
jgi:hypothetical protein